MKAPKPITTRTIATLKVATQKALEAFNAATEVVHELSDSDAKGNIVKRSNRTQAAVNAAGQCGIASEALKALRAELEADMIT